MCDASVITSCAATVSRTSCDNACLSQSLGALQRPQVSPLSYVYRLMPVASHVSIWPTIVNSPSPYGLCFLRSASHKVCCPSNGVGAHSAWRAVSSRWRSVRRLMCIRVTPCCVCCLTLVHEVASVLPPLNPRYVIKSVSAHPLLVLAQTRMSVRKPYRHAFLHRPEGRLTFSC